MNFLRFAILFAIWTAASAAQAVTVQRFEPLADTLTQYGITKIPEAADYPEVPAVALLSLQEYKQLGLKHERRFHKIVKILTPAGKEYTTIKIACFASCRIDARTIKANGKIINLPGKDLVRSEKITGYESPYFFAQFAMPGVEPGDIIEYDATIEYPYPFYIDDFRFAEPYPILKGVLILTHPSDYAYTYLRYSPPGTPPIESSRDTFTENQIAYLRTTFVAENVRAVADEPYAPGARQSQPGVRIVIGSRGGREFDVFKDWWSYGAFIAEQTELSALPPAAIKSFVVQAIQNNTEPTMEVRLIYQEADKRIQIVKQTLVESGFEFQDPEKVLQKGAAAPHDFALFLASCFKSLRWESDLILVNSHDRAEASKDAPFPPDLDLVYLNVKTPAGEFLLDCNRNGMPVGALESDSMNRFALGIPLSAAHVISSSSSNPTYVTRMPFRDGNKSHIDLTAVPVGDAWNVDFRWFLGGEFQGDFMKTLRQQGDADLRKDLAAFLRKRIHADQFKDVDYKLLPTGMELHGRATIARHRVSDSLELLQNDFWDSGFDLRPYLLENRANALLLPVAGEISSSYRIQLEPGVVPAVPQPLQLECSPIRYSLAVQQGKQEIRVNEKILISDLQVRPPVFAKFVEFLDRYDENHFWSILMSAQPAIASK